MEAVYGRDRAEMLAQLSRQELDATVSEIKGSAHPEDSKLKLALDGRSPDDGMTDIAYNKGYFFLRLIEETVGRAKFDEFLKNYFTSHSFQVMDTETFIDYLRKNLVDAETEKKIDIHAWVYEPGLPANIPSVQSTQLNKVDEIIKEWDAKKIASKDLPWNTWSYQERYRFISNFNEAITATDMADLDKLYDISHIGNNEVLFTWLQMSIRKKYTTAYPELENFLTHVGRRKFVAPLFEEMVSTEQTELAIRIYEKARPTYHAVTVGTVDEMLKEYR